MYIYPSKAYYAEATQQILFKFLQNISEPTTIVKGNNYKK